MAGARAREPSSNRCLPGGFSARLRHYTRGRAVYQALAIFAPERQADATRFLDSFRLLTPASTSSG